MAWFQSKQQKLAVEMWEYIKKNVQNHPEKLIGDLKDNFVEMHGLESKWVHNCWLCENAREDCSKCKLRSCKNYDTPWGIVSNVFNSTKERLDACDVIIKAIKNTDRYYVLENNKLTTVPGNRKTTFEGTLKECLAYIVFIQDDDEAEVEEDW